MRDTHPTADLHLVTGPEDAPRVRSLFLEYQEAIGVDLCFQSFAEELAGLPGAYAAPRGRLYVAVVGGADAACGALRPAQGDACELKRMWVRPAFRGTGLGRRLATTLIADARAIGYRTMVLDTLPAMSEAQALYRTLGFVEIPAYRFNPHPGTLYFELHLQALPRAGRGDTLP